MIRIYAMVLCPNQNEYCGDQVEKLYDYKGKLTVRAVKLIADGALGSWGAWMLKKYNDKDTTGLTRLKENSILDLMHKWTKNNFQVNVHCIGDKANRIILDAHEELRKKNIISKRPRIEHAQILHPHDIPRFASLKVIPSVQPTHCTSDMNIIESRIGNRSQGAYIWKSFLDSGSMHLPLGSDFPVEDVDPLKGIYSATTRRSTNGVPWHPKEILSKYQALKGFTIDAAYAAFQESQIGSLEVGKFADFVVFDKNFMEDDENALLNNHVKSTTIGGQLVWGSY